MTSGEWLGSMMPPAPRRMVEVFAATWAISTEVAEEAIEGKLWCSANQIRVNPCSSAVRARSTVAATASATGWPGRTVDRSRIDSG